MPRLLLAFFFSGLVAYGTAHASPNTNNDISHDANYIVAQYIPNAMPVGKTQFNYLFWSVYAATLYAPHGVWQRQPPFALSLRYLRQLNGEAIAKRSAEEMRQQKQSDEVQLATWFTQMKRIFPDVNKGTVLTGILTAEQATRFYHQSSPEAVPILAGEIKDPAFGPAFFDIWLSEKTSQPAMRRQLLGVE